MPPPGLRPRAQTVAGQGVGLYPNVDFYSGLIYQAMGFPMSFFLVLFAVPRTSGWLTQWEEMFLDPEQEIARPRQLYLGPGRRDFVPLDQRR